MGYNVNFKQLCGNQNIDYDLPGYQFDLTEFSSQTDFSLLNYEKRTNMIYKQNWKFVTDLKLNCDDSNNSKSTLFLTNVNNKKNKVFERISTFLNNNIITVILNNDQPHNYSKISDVQYELAINKKFFKMLQNDIQKIPKIIIYHYEDIKGI